MTHACVYMCVLSNSPSKYARKHLMGIMKKKWKSYMVGIVK
jgi:hypothetical protein